MPYDDETLEAAAELLERLGGNYMYEKAWKAGAKKIRALKKLTSEPQKLTDSREELVANAGYGCR